MESTTKIKESSEEGAHRTVIMTKQVIRQYDKKVAKSLVYTIS